MASVEERQAAMARFVQQFRQTLESTLNVVIGAETVRYAQYDEQQCDVPVDQVTSELYYFQRAMLNHAEKLLSETALYNYIQ